MSDLLSVFMDFQISFRCLEPPKNISKLKQQIARATGPPRYGARVGVGMLRGAGDLLLEKTTVSNISFCEFPILC